MKKRAYLFDIDGTLLRLKRRAHRTIIKQMLRQFNSDGVDVEKMDFAGKTDRDIFSGLLNNPDEVFFNKVKGYYIKTLEKQLNKEDIFVLDGVTETLHYLEQNASWKGLLTGNFAGAAEVKLRKTGLHQHFPFGAYGDNDHDRNALPFYALKELQNYSKTSFSSSELVIIGDTPRDIRCAQAFGAVSVAVATATFSYKQLKSYNPDVVLSSLKEFPAWDKSW